MPKFRYTAVDLNNRVIKGDIEAANVSDLYTLLRTKSLTLTSSEEIRNIKAIYTLKSPEVCNFARQMSEMLGAGLTIVKALGILRERDTEPKITAIYDQIYKYIYEGMTMSEALRKTNNAFPELFVNMCEAGEKSGQLELTMKRMAVHYDKEYRLQKKISGAMRYPLILLAITLLAVIAIFCFIMPEFFALFEGMDLPLPTAIVIGLSHLLTNYWYIMIAVAILIPITIRYLLSMPTIRLWWDKTKFGLPLVKKLLPIIYTARFSRALNSLYSSGLPLIDSMTIASRLTGNKYLESQFPAVISAIRNGDTLSNSIRVIKEFDPKLPTTIFIGEESGRLGTMLESMADSYDYEAEEATSKLVAYLEPLMIVLMAGVVGVIMIAVFMPIFSLYSNVEGMS